LPCDDSVKNAANSVYTFINATNLQFKPVVRHDVLTEAEGKSLIVISHITEYGRLIIQFRIAKFHFQPVGI